MRNFIDCEFIEDGKTIELISIGIVSEDNRTYYAISTEFNPKKASQWVKDNVLNQLPPRHTTEQDSPRIRNEALAWKSRKTIAIEVAEFLGCHVDCEYPVHAKGWRNIWDRLRLEYFPEFANVRYRYQLKDWIETPEFWAYYADYDWVVFCQLFGTMLDLPKGFPMYCNDIKQECDRLGNPKLPEQDKGSHNALADAMWNKQAWEFLQTLKK